MSLVTGSEGLSDANVIPIVADAGSDMAGRQRLVTIERERR